MTRNEAEAVVSELQKVVAPLATKDDLAKIGESIRSDMRTMEESMENSMATKVELANMETRLFWKLSAVMLGVGALVVSIVELI